MVAYSAGVSQPVRSLSAPRNFSIVLAAHSSNDSEPLPLRSSLANALRRGAKIYAEMVGYGATADGADMVAPSGEGAVRCMQMALANVLAARLVRLAREHHGQRVVIVLIPVAHAAAVEHHGVIQKIPIAIGCRF